MDFDIAKKVSHISDVLEIIELKELPPIQCNEEN